jgi:hypothetical protein
MMMNLQFEILASASCPENGGGGVVVRRNCYKLHHGLQLQIRLLAWFRCSAWGNVHVK